MHGGLAAGIKPVAGEIERRAIAVLEAENVDIEILGLFEILRFDRVVLQSAKRNGSSPCYSALNFWSKSFRPKFFKPKFRPR
jgi:hypothetical protein